MATILIGNPPIQVPLSFLLSPLAHALSGYDEELIKFLNIPTDWAGDIQTLLSFIFESSLMTVKLIEYLAKNNIQPIGYQVDYGSLAFLPPPTPSSSLRPALTFPVKRNGAARLVNFDRVSTLGELKRKIAARWELSSGNLTFYQVAKEGIVQFSDEESVWQRFYDGRISIIEPLIARPSNEPPLGDRCEKCAQVRMDSTKCKDCAFNPV